MATILIVDDEPSVRTLLKLAFERGGYEVATACDGVDAIRMCRLASEPFAVVLCDIVMPNMNGYDLAAWLADNYPGTRILLMSGYGGDSHPSGPPCTVLLKPFLPTQALEYIGSMLAPPACAAALSQPL